MENQDAQELEEMVRELGEMAEELEKVLHHLPVFPGQTQSRDHRATDVHRLRQHDGNLRDLQQCPEAGRGSRRYDQLLPLQALDRVAGLIFFGNPLIFTCFFRFA